MTGYFPPIARSRGTRGPPYREPGADAPGGRLYPQRRRNCGHRTGLRSADEGPGEARCTNLTPPDEEAKAGLELLKWMIQYGVLEVKVAVPVDEKRIPIKGQGIYHVKVGIIEDAQGNRLSFSGSLNETAGGWKNNCEEIKVYWNWADPATAEYAQLDTEAFTELWSGDPKRVAAYDFTDALRENLLNTCPTAIRRRRRPRCWRTTKRHSATLWNQKRFGGSCGRGLPRRPVWRMGSQSEKDVGSRSMAAPAAHISGLPQPRTCMSPADSGRSRLRKDNHSRPHSAAVMDLQPRKADSDSGAKGRTDPVAERALREVQPRHPHL